MIRRFEKGPLGRKRIAAISAIWFMAALILAQLLVAGAFGLAKESYHLDEIYTYGLANSYNKPFLGWDEDALSWHSPDFYHNYLTVQTNQRFAYESVYYNLSHDNHPPLYFIGIHTVCSFFPDAFSKWLGIGFNLIFLVTTVIVLYFLSMQIARDKKLALLVCAAYGFSTGAVSNTIFIRMYMMLTFFTVLTTYLHGRFILDRSGRVRILLAILAATVMGFLTQYFFAIYAFFLAAGCMVYLWRRGRHRDLISYTGTMTAAALGGIILFPPCLGIILGGKMGTDVIGNFGEAGDFLERITTFGGFISKSFGGPFLFMILLLGLAAIICTAALKRKRESGAMRVADVMQFWFGALMSPERRAWLVILSGATLLTFLVIAKIAPYYSQRYIASLLPQITALVVLIGYAGIHALVGNRDRSHLLVTMVIVGCTAFSYVNGGVDYLYKSKADDLEETMAAYRQYDAFCVAAKSYNLTIALPLLMRHENSCYVSLDSTAGDIEAMEAGQGARRRPIVVYFPRWQDRDWSAPEVLDRLIASGDYTSVSQILSEEESGLVTSAYILEYQQLGITWCLSPSY